MGRTWRTIRRAVGAPLAALMLLMGAAGPIMDAADLLAEHRAVGCEGPAPQRWGHDHRLCLQVGANQAFPSDAALRPAVWTVRSGDGDDALTDRWPAPDAAAPSARAPPSR